MCNDTQFPCNQRPIFAEELSRLRHGRQGSLKRERTAFLGDQAMRFMTSDPGLEEAKVRHGENGSGLLAGASPL